MVTIPAMTTAEIMARKFGEYGLTSYGDHNPENGDSAPVRQARIDAVVQDCVDQASAEIAMLAGQRYDLDDLAAHPIVIPWATTYAIYFLCQRRGNPMPQSLADEFNRVTANLEKIVAGDIKLPGLDEITGMRPTVSNLVIDRRYVNDQVRVRSTTGETPSALPVHNYNRISPFG